MYCNPRVIHTATHGLCSPHTFYINIFLFYILLFFNCSITYRSMQFWWLIKVSSWSSKNIPMYTRNTSKGPEVLTLFFVLLDLNTFFKYIFWSSNTCSVIQVQHILTWTYCLLFSTMFFCLLFFFFPLSPAFVSYLSSICFLLYYPSVKQTERNNWLLGMESMGTSLLSH